MRGHLIAIVLGSLCASLFCGCALENETAEKIIQEDPLDTEDRPEYEKTFLELAKKCIVGEFDVSPRVVKLYASTLGPTDYAKKVVLPDYHNAHDEKMKIPPYAFQKSELNVFFEVCLEKNITGGKSDYEQYYISRNVAAARISRYFYAEGHPKDGAYWSRRVVNLLGRAQGYYILGRVFLEDDRTVRIGAGLLKESAKLGNDAAKQLLFDRTLNVSVFDRLKKKEDLPD